MKKSILLFVFCLCAVSTSWAQDTDWFSASCASRINENNYVSFDMAKHPEINTLMYCKLFIAAYKISPIFFGSSQIGETGELFHRKDGIETKCNYEVKKEVTRKSDIVRKFLNIFGIQEEQSSDILKNFLDENKDFLLDAVEVTCPLELLSV